MFSEEVSLGVSKRVAESYASLLGVSLGGGLFLVVVVAGVIFWVTRERAEDLLVAGEAEKFQEERRRGRGLSVEVEERKDKYVMQDFSLYRFFNGGLKR